VPRRPEQRVPPPQRPPRREPGEEDYSLRVDVPLVTVDVLVTTRDGQFIPGLRPEHFRIMEDNVPQKVSNFSQVGDAPITAVLLVEFANTNYYFMIDALNAAYTFADSLQKEDWVAVVAYDMRPEIMVDFTQDKRAVYAALNQLRIPGFSETNLFDSLVDTIDRIEQIEGRKYIILISSGVDTFSRLTLDRALKRVQGTQDITIFSISTGRAIREWASARGYLRPENEITFLQGDNQMRHFAAMTGGRWYNPRFVGEFPNIFRDVAASIRNQYTLAYQPTNAQLDGSYRKLKVELVGPDGKALEVKDQKGRRVRYNVLAREGYTARRPVE
jgi:VWFA-related protein